MVFWVKTRDDTAKIGDDYEPIHQMITMRKGQQSTSVRVTIHDDDIWEPDKDFFVELFDEEDSLKPLEGEDC